MMSAMDSPDAADPLAGWVAQAQAGDERAFLRVYRTVHPLVLRYLVTLVGQDAEDVASEAWAQVARDLGAFRGDGAAFRAWTATIARNRALDHVRRQRRRPTAGVDAHEMAIDRPGGDDTEGLALESLSTDRAIALISSLPRDQAEAVLLRAVMGLDARTAGEVLGKRAGAVRTAAHRGLRRLAELLGDAAAPSARYGPRSPVPPDGASDE
jgi:RNA polymerase sigma-70 factor (ECF subfamily)